jgi:hypothetical protein
MGLLLRDPLTPPDDYLEVAAGAAVFTAVSLAALFLSARLCRWAYSDGRPWLQRYWRELAIVTGIALFVYAFATRPDGDDPTRPLLMAVSAAIVTVGALALRKRSS